MDAYKNQMYNVLWELMNKERMCYTCDEYIGDLSVRQVRTWVKCRNVFCSVECVINGEYDFFDRYERQFMGRT
jgi:hypothetical protein